MEGGARWRSGTDVWKLATHAYKGSHFATFPPALVEPCITGWHQRRRACVASAGRRGSERLIEKSQLGDIDAENLGMNMRMTWGQVTRSRAGGQVFATYKRVGINNRLAAHLRSTTAEVRPATVLDPFAGSGTVGLVADRLGRDAILIELNPEYAAMAEQRIVGENPLFCKVEVKDGSVV